MSLIDEAAVFAVRAHSGQYRKMGAIPYIIHPMEVASIIATLTDDQEIMAAGLLHDTIEDCGVTPEEIEEKFGPRVLFLILSDTENRSPFTDPQEAWLDRKHTSIERLKHSSDPAVKIMWLADKLSNIRSISREHERIGDLMFGYLTMQDPGRQAWYYMTIRDELRCSELKDSPAFREYEMLLEKVFGYK